MFADDDFTGITAINLEVGREYEILESCGMSNIRGEYLGVADRRHSERLLVFRIVSVSFAQGEEHESNYRYCGASIRVDLPYRTESPVKVYLQQTHYGHSVATLRKVGSNEDDRWEIR